MIALPQIVPELHDVDLQISGVADDTRRVGPGELFIAVAGERYSVAQMLEDIQSSGAAAVLVDANEAVSADSSVVPMFKIPHLQEKRGGIASRYYGEPSNDMFMVGVTGTNGKTSCSQFIASALAEKCGVVGTMGWGFPPDLQEPGLTTPSALRLQELLAGMLQQGATAVCVEASSHGLVQHRLAGVAIDTAVFTNLTRDHLDYHGSLESYQSAKKRLFTDFAIKFAVVNLDDPLADEIISDVAASVEVIRYSLRSQDADIYCRDLKFSNEGICAEVETPWGAVSIQSDLIGEFNASNLLAVIGVLGSKGYNAALISERVSQLTNVRGRMDRMTLPNGALAVIDYAHTPDALENALRALRVHCRGKLWCVMGCGGDRDQGKRPMMGEASGRLADVTVITDDNPRSESSEFIIGQIQAGLPSDCKHVAISDRAAAIEYALMRAGRQDIVLIAGKGHEDYQEINGERQPFSDHEQVQGFNDHASQRRLVVIGFGITGQSVVRYARANGLAVVVAEDNPDNQTSKLPMTAIADLELTRFDRVMLSPGVPLKHPFVAAARNKGFIVSNDIELFSEICTQPLCLVTGSNGKSTVSSFINQLLNAAGRRSLLGGNIGVPVLDLLQQEADAFVLELSSYQLEVATHTQAKVAVLLNLTPDHLDRYDSVEAYYQAKTHIFRETEVAIYPRDIEFDLNIPASARVITFGLDAPLDHNYGVVEVNGEQHLACGGEAIYPVAQLPLKGEHEVLNILAALAAAEAMGVERERVLGEISALERLEHRFELLPEMAGHLAINDSKSTNPASAAAALRNLVQESRPVVLLLGGLAKDADFAELSEAIASQVSRCLVYGADREKIAGELGVACECFDSLADCLAHISLAEPSVILFSPGCASQDEFSDFQARGRYFKQTIQERFS